MAEDSGAFKTNPANSRQVPAFVKFQRSLTGFGNALSNINGALIALIFNKHHEYVAVSSNQPDSLRAGGARRVGNAAILSSPRSLWLKAFANDPAKAELAFMLPGFRFLFAAIVLSMSILVFGLGAAALLRAAHEEFASTPSWHASPEPVFAQRTETQGPVTEGPVLAMLHVEPPAAEEKAPDQVAAATTPAEQPAASDFPAEPEVTAKPAETEATATPAKPEVTAVPAEPERTAALQPKNSTPPEAAKPEMPVAESPAEQEAAPAQAVAPAATDETRMATSTPISTPTSASASEEVSAPASEAAPAAPEQAGPPASADADSASIQIATLGGPAVTIEAAPPVKTTVARHLRSVIKKRVEARRKTRHRRTALRARFVQQLPQQQSDPFGQSFAAARRR
jgi:hypothetical protein